MEVGSCFCEEALLKAPRFRLGLQAVYSLRAEFVDSGSSLGHLVEQRSPGPAASSSLALLLAYCPKAFFSRSQTSAFLSRSFSSEEAPSPCGCGPLSALIMADYKRLL